MSRPGETYEPLLSSWSLGGIVRDICERQGLPYFAINTDLLEGYVDGFSTTSAQTSSAAIEALAGVYQFDSANYDGALNFIMRGTLPEIVIDEGDLIDDGDPVEILTRNDAINIPKVMHLQYLDTDGGMTADKQTSDRSLDSRASSESSQETTVIMRADDAAKAITIMHKVSIEEQRGEKTFSLPDNYLFLSVADVVRLGKDRLRITKIDIDEGFQKYTAVFDRASAYTTDIIGLPIVPPSTPPNLEPSESVMEFLDIHILSSQDDQLGYYIAVSSLTDEWAGAVVELSKDGGQTWIDGGFIGSNSVLGTIYDALPWAPVWYPDRNNTLHVELLRDNMELQTATLAEMMNRANLCIVGDELINFGEAEQVDENRWECTTLLRGRKGSPISAHTAGERFVMLDAGSVTWVPAELFELGRALTFRVTSVGLAPGTDSQTFTLVGNSQRERQPAYLKAYRRSGQIDISWQGVGRLGGGSSVGMGSYFTGYRVYVNGSPTDTNAMSLTITDPGGAVTIAVRQVNQITGEGPAATITI